VIRSRSTRCRIGVAGRGLWYVDRLGNVYNGKPPREVIEAILADPTLTVDLGVLKRLGYLPADLRTDERQVADLNRHLDPLPMDPTEPIGDSEDWRDLWVGLATSLMLGVFVWAAVALWVYG
jgi:hypothetical protein